MLVVRDEGINDEVGIVSENERFTVNLYCFLWPGSDFGFDGGIQTTNDKEVDCLIVAHSSTPLRSDSTRRMESEKVLSPTKPTTNNNIVLAGNHTG